MGDKFEMINAFSRETSKKVYVQHRLQEHAKEVGELLSQKAFFYVCGDAAHMAREVNAVLAKIIAEARGVTEAKAEEIVKSMRAANQYQVCDWHLSLTSLLFSHDALPLHPNYFLTNLPGGRLVLRQYSTRSTTFGRNSRLGFQQGLSGLGLGSSTAADKEHELE